MAVARGTVEAIVAAALAKAKTDRAKGEAQLRIDLAAIAEKAAQARVTLGY